MLLTHKDIVYSLRTFIFLNTYFPFKMFDIFFLMGFSELEAGLWVVFIYNFIYFFLF